MGFALFAPPHDRLKQYGTLMATTDMATTGKQHAAETKLDRLRQRSVQAEAGGGIERVENSTPQERCLPASA
jgi:hypothetical protein